jgi:hypothetical protein
MCGKRLIVALLSAQILNGRRRRAARFQCKAAQPEIGKLTLARDLCR